MANQQISALAAELAAGQITRRQFVQRAIVAGFSATAIAQALSNHASAAPGSSAQFSASTMQADETTLVIADDLQNAWITLDPGWIYEINSQVAENVVYEPLYTIIDSTKPTEITPILATDFPVFSDDGLTATITLREGVKFHNSGNLMTANDVVFSWNRTKNIKWQAAFLATDHRQRRGGRRENHQVGAEISERRFGADSHDRAPGRHRQRVCQGERRHAPRMRTRPTHSKIGTTRTRRSELVLSS